MARVTNKIPQELLKGLSPSALNTMIGSVTLQVAELLRGKIAVEPGPSNSPVIWASDRQRKFYFAKRRQLGLDPKYTRNSDPTSQRISASWEVARSGLTNAVVGTNVTYAPYVQSARRQSAQHAATGWITDEKAIAAVSDRDIGQIVLSALRTEFP